MSEIQNRPMRVFLCHASDDKPAVRELYRFLRQNGIDAWLDEEKLLPGQDWRVEIPKALKSSDAIIVCLSKRSVSKEGYVQKEIKFALDVADEKPEGTIFVIPARLEECLVPERLSQWQWVDLFRAERGQQWLLRGLELRAVEQGLVISYSPLEDSSPKNLARKMIAGMPFVFIPKGKFLMGSKENDEQAYDDEKPQHSQDVPYDFWIGRFPVTNEQFATFVKAKSHQTKAEKEGYGWNWSPEKKNWVKISGANWMQPYGSISSIKSISDHPVVMVSWYDAMTCCDWLNRMYSNELPAGLVFRLPSEAEWEKAARGETGNIWPWGDEWEAWRCNSKENGPGFTTPVGAYSPDGDSPYGVADMSGNVWEWTRSLWGTKTDTPAFKYPYNHRDGREDLNATADVLRVLRGGSFYLDASNVRVSCRHRYYPDISFDNIGFRVALAPHLS